jgi:glycosyltransferase involved in cell wall biosynthesis
MISAKTIKSRSDIVSSLRKGFFVREKSLSICCDKVTAIPYRDVVELYLYLSRARRWEWFDSNVNISSKQPLLKIVTNLSRDVIVWPLIYLNRSRTVAQLHKLAHVQGVLQAGSSVLFLRTDHWFNVKSGGSVGHLSGVIHGLQALGYRPHVVSTGHLVGVEEDDHFHLCEPVYDFGRNLPNMPELLYNEQLVHYIDKQWVEWSPSFIYQRYSLGNYAGVLLKQKYGVLYVCEYNGSFPWIARHWIGRRLFHEKLMTRIELLNLEAADVVVVVSRPMKDELVARGIKADKILINPNGVDPERYSPDVDGSETRRQYELNGKTVVGFVSTFGPWHGAEELAKTAAMLCKYGNPCNLHFLFIGDGMRRTETESILREAGIAQHSTFSGLIPQELGPKYLAACDILVAPHVPNPDGTPFFGSPTKLFEYMAMAKGIVASDLDQIGEILEDGETAVLVRPGDPDDLARGILYLVEHPQEAACLGQNARREVVNNYTWEQNVKRVIQALEQIQRFGKIREA